MNPGPDLGRIHHTATTNVDEIVGMLEIARLEGTRFHSGLGRLLDRESAQLESVTRESLCFSTQHFDLEQRERVVLTFRAKGDLYLMSSPLLESSPQTQLIRVALPSALFRVERRDRPRRPGGFEGEAPTKASLRWRELVVEDARVVDYSGDGVALELSPSDAARLGKRVELTFVDGPDAGEPKTGFLRHRKPLAGGGDEVGMSVTSAPPGVPIPVERRVDVFPRSQRAELQQRWKVLRAGARLTTRRALRRLGARQASAAELELIRFENAKGEHIVALRDSWQPQAGAPWVVIPPAWAKTKETLLPLARTIVATFQKSDVPVNVLRLDGIRRRGESYNDPDNRVLGRECHGMTFSQGVDDIRATLDFLHGSSELRPSTVILVTFSGASIEARKALYEESDGRVGGWVSVVGAADLLSGLRVVSGGQDYIGGYERGVRFGLQRVLGIETNADEVCRDALETDLAHLEDARRQMAKIDVPITWIQGRHDAWIDAERVREILSCGEQSNRRLLEVPTGHQLRTSKEALDVFQLIASEAGRFATGEPLDPELPDLADVERRRQAERARVATPEVDLAQFWTEYLLGRDQLPGMELLTGTAPYRELMAAQTACLRTAEGDRIADLGSGLGTFPLHLSTAPALPAGVEVHEFDFLADALTHCARRLDARSSRPKVRYLLSDLSFASGARYIPVRDGTYDAVLASLVLNYVEQPVKLLAEARRILRPGGRLVLSALRPDPDISTIYVEAAKEIRARKASGLYEELPLEVLEKAVRSFLNEAAKLVDFEEVGLFRSWDADELGSLIRNAGFGVVEIRTCFGDPPQAIVVSAVAQR